MSRHLCPRCGVNVLPAAKFCSDCGVPLRGDVRPRWRPTAAGGGVLAFLVVAGLTIWTVILSPAPPRPGPSGPRPGLPSGAPVASQETDTQKPVALPAEVKKFIADLAAKARDAPDDAASWVRLAQVSLRAGQLDPSYYPEALGAFEHVLELDPRNAEALRGIANVHYERDQHKEAVAFFERYLALRPDDVAARTDLGTMYLYTGEPARAAAAYQEAIRKDPSFLQAHYNLAITYHRQGNDADALAELAAARPLAPDDGVRKQIDDLIAALHGRPAPPGGATTAAAVPRTPFQAAVEQAFRDHPIMGPRIVRFEWSGPATGKVVVQNFPMEGMPPAVREKFAARLGQELRSAQDAHHVGEDVRVDIADAGSGVVMATVIP